MVVDRRLCNVNIFLYFSTVTANLATFGMGGAFVWSSPAIPRLNGQMVPESNPLPQSITALEESWLASLLPLGAAFSAFLSGYLADRIGRKSTMLVSSIPMILGYGLLTFGTNITQFLIGRFLCGLGSGTAYTLMPMYVGEISEKHNRGALCCCFSFFFSSGGLFFITIAPYVTLRTLGAINLTVPILFIFLFGLFAPESPYYYIAKNKEIQAMKSLLRLRFNNAEMAQKELPEIAKNVKESFARKSGLKDLYIDKSIRKGFYVAVILVFLQQWSGINTIFFYMQTIFQEAESGIPAEYCAIIPGVVEFLSTAGTIAMADKFGRRFLLLISSIGNAVTLLGTAIYFFLKEETTIDTGRFNWLPIVTINLFTAFYSTGMGPISFTMVGELFPPHVKSFASTITIFVCLFSTFSVTNLYPVLKGAVGMWFGFCFLSVVCFTTCFFIYLKVPETKGKSLQEIQKLL